MEACAWVRVKKNKRVCGHHFEFAARTEDSARELRPSWEDETTADMTCTATAAAAPVAAGAPCTSAAPQQQEQRRRQLPARANLHLGNTSTHPTVVVSAVSSFVSTSSCSCTRVPASAAVRLQSRPLYPGKHLLEWVVEP
jgi:hypothetical protein